MAGISATVWHYQCPDCGFGDVELGDVERGDAAISGEGFCVVCLEEQGRRVRLRCWQAEAPRPVRRVSAAA
jgi:uncharacterized protein YbbK (DUF523 family)